MNWINARRTFIGCAFSMALTSPFAAAETVLDEASPAVPATVKEEVAARDESVDSKKTSSKSRKGSKVEPALEVEFFAAMADGKFTVDYIPKDATQANLIFRNQSDQPLKIKLPETFAAVHVLGQGMGGGGMGGGGFGGGGMGGGGGGAQAAGGGMGGGMDMGMDMGGGLFRVDLDKPRKVTVPTVCLEHGKPDPNPRLTYKIVPLEVVNADPKVAEICKLLGHGKVSQNAAQAVAWHFTDGLSWQELLNKPRVVSKYTGVQMFFSRYEIQTAIRLVGQITVAVSDAEVAADSSSQSDSESDYQSTSATEAAVSRSGS